MESMNPESSISRMFISIWFFIGISLLVNGAIILATGVYELMHPPQFPPVLFQLHASVWWGGLLTLLGAFYCWHFAPSRKVGK